MKVSKIIDKIQILYDVYVSYNSSHANKLSLSFVIVTGLITAAVKVIAGIALKSIIWAYAGIYAFLLVMARIYLLKCVDKPDEQVHRRINMVAVFLMLTAVAFDLCAMLKQYSEENVSRYPTIIVIIASFYFLFFYIMAIIGLVESRKKGDIIFYANKVIGISAALMNMILLQRMILSCTKVSVEKIIMINAISSYSIGGMLILAAIVLLAKNRQKK